MSEPFDFSLVKAYYHISPEGAEHPVAELPAVEFYDTAKLKEIMIKAGETVQATDLTLPASFFGTSLCNVCVTKLIFLAQYNVLLDLPLENLTFQVEMHDDHSHLGYKINELRYQELPADVEDAFLLAHWESFIKDTVTPSVEIIAKTASVKPAMIWLQYGGLMGMVWDFVRQHEQRPEVLARFERFFRMMSEAFPPEWFNRSRNPFQHVLRYTDNPYQPGEQLVMRSACCHYDCRMNGEKCYICPRLTDAEREEMRIRIQALEATS